MPPLWKGRKFFKYLLIDYSNFACLNPKGYHREALQTGTDVTFVYMAAMQHRYQTQAAPALVPQSVSGWWGWGAYVHPFRSVSTSPQPSPAAPGYWSTASDWLAEDHVSVISMPWRREWCSIYSCLSFKRWNRRMGLRPKYVYAAFFPCTALTFNLFLPPNYLLFQSPPIPHVPSVSCRIYLTCPE